MVLALLSAVSPRNTVCITTPFYSIRRSIGGRFVICGKVNFLVMVPIGILVWEKQLLSLLSLWLVFATS